MTTKTAGGKITGLLALTVEAQEAMEVGDWVQLSGDYEVELADGTKSVFGKVSVPNKKRISSVLGTSVGNPSVPGVVTVETPAFWVSTETAAEAIAAGDDVALTASGLVTAATAAVNEVSKITITATGGTYTITYAGQTTTALQYNETAANITTALVALSNVASGDLVASGTGATRTITAGGTFVSADLADLTVNDALATGGDVTIETVAQGSAGANPQHLIVGIALTSANEGEDFDLAAR